MWLNLPSQQSRIRSAQLSRTMLREMRSHMDSILSFRLLALRAQFWQRFEPDVARREKPCKRGAPKNGGGREVTGGRLHHDIRHSSPPPSFVTLPPSFPLSLSFSSFSVMLLSVFSLSAALSCAFRHAAFRSVSPVTDCRSGDRDNNNCQRSNISQASRGRERAWRWRRGGGCREREREEEKGPTGLFIEPATNIEQLVSIRPVIAAFTQSLSYPLAKWRRGRANIHLFPGTMYSTNGKLCIVQFFNLC